MGTKGGVGVGSKGGVGTKGGVGVGTKGGVRVGTKGRVGVIVHMCSVLRHTFLPSDKRGLGCTFTLRDLVGGTKSFSVPQPASTPISDSGPTGPPSPLLACGGTRSTTVVCLTHTASRTSQPTMW